LHLSKMADVKPEPQINFAHHSTRFVHVLLETRACFE
jgi:hypothetical protein